VRKLTRRLCEMHTKSIVKYLNKIFTKIFVRLYFQASFVLLGQGLVKTPVVGLNIEETHTSQVPPREKDVIIDLPSRDEIIEALKYLKDNKAAEPVWTR
jgi:hypothetical protein